jgi:putative redox protein
VTVIAHVTATSTGGYAQQIRSGRHELAADEPPSRGGDDTGPAPFALLLGALAACTSITLRMYAERKGWTLGTIALDLKYIQSDDGTRIERGIRVSAPLDPQAREKLLEIAGKTPVTKVIHAAVPVETTLTAGS